MVFGETCGFGPSFPCCNTRNTFGGGQCVAPANTQYTVTLKRFCFEIRHENDLTETLECVGSEMPFNFAAAGIDTLFANFVTSEPIPNTEDAGGHTILAVRPEVLKSLTVEGGGQSFHTTLNGVPCSSGGAQTANAGGAAIPACVEPLDPDKTKRKTCETATGAIRIRDTSLGEVEVKPAGVEVQFFFDAGSSLIFNLVGLTCPFFSPGPLLIEMKLGP